MKKIFLTLGLVIIACLVAGLYGAIHNQISYSVSPEYFTKFKFHQFQIPETVSDRVGAAMVGWAAAWWMGIIISIILIPVGMTIPGTRNLLQAMLQAFAMVALTALIIGLVALGLSFVIVRPGLFEIGSPYGETIVDATAFVRAGTMHNFSYLGGLIGIVTGVRSIWRTKQSLVGKTESENVKTGVEI